MAGHFVRWTGDPGFPANDLRIPQAITDTAQQFADKRAFVSKLLCRVGDSLGNA